MSLFKKPLYLTDGGLETYMIFEKDVKLRSFAAFELLQTAVGLKHLTEYYQPFLDLAGEKGLPFVLETPTWRANSDWGKALGYERIELERINRNAIDYLRSLVHDMEETNIIISGSLGPRADGYVPGKKMSEKQAEIYHQEQIKSFALADADALSGMTINYVDEAIGMTKAAYSFGIPIVISFTVETDGKLPDGHTIREAILQTDEATNGYATHFMINCAHPSHFAGIFDDHASWHGRIGGIRANASRKSHAELDASETLDSGDACELGKGYRDLITKVPSIKVVGGCCGTNIEHIREICHNVVMEKETPLNR